MKHRGWLKKIEKMVAIKGEQEILVGLVNSGVPPSTAEKIVRGEYRPIRFRRKTAARIEAFFERSGRTSA